MIKLLYIIVFLIILYIYLYKKQKHGNIFNTYFGVPGSGKTTFAAKISQNYLKQGIKVYSNVPIKDTFAFEKTDLGKFDMSNSLIIYDEVGIDFNNRNFKNNLTPEMLYLFKYHRHYNIDIVIFSQSYRDMDLKLRDLSTKYFLMKKSIIPFLFTSRQIKKYIGINKEQQQIDDLYDFVPFSLKYTYGPRYWKYFDSYERKELPDKDFTKW